MNCAVISLLGPFRGRATRGTSPSVKPSAAAGCTGIVCQVTDSHAPLAESDLLGPSRFVDYRLSPVSLSAEVRNTRFLRVSSAWLWSRRAPSQNFWGMRLSISSPPAPNPSMPRSVNLVPLPQCEEHRRRILGESCQIGDMVAEQVGDLRRRGISAPNPDHFRWGAIHQAELVEVRILGDQEAPLLGRMAPDFDVGRPIQSSRFGVGGAREKLRERGNQSPREVLVKEQFH